MVKKKSSRRLDNRLDVDQTKGIAAVLAMIGRMTTASRSELSQSAYAQMSRRKVQRTVIEIETAESNAKAATIAGQKTHHAVVRSPREGQDLLHLPGWIKHG